MTPVHTDDWECVIGLEIHVELNTRTKLFSYAANHFGSEPNTNITDICTGQPGTLPVLNQEAVHKAVLLGCALHSQIATYSHFDRKSYFYPDSPRNFQITQFEMPLVIGGTLTTEIDGEPKTFYIDRAHLEDDAGMLKHFSHFAGIDYNRAGVPLIEIVSKPCLFSAKEAISYATAMRAILQYIDVSDCNMEEGSLRIDANISVRPKGSTELRNKVEIKNLNSFAFMGSAIESESKRQIRAYTSQPQKDPKEVIEPSTYRWDPEKKEAVLMRRKESSDDYRYFIEPDLPPLTLEESYIEKIRAQLPELPYEREKRYRSLYQLPPELATILVQDKALADYYEKALTHCTNAKGLCNWLIVEFAGRYKESGKNVWNSGIPASAIGKLVTFIDQGTITGKIAKSVADLMVQYPEKDLEQIIQENPDFQPLSDTAEIEGIVDQILLDHTQSIQDYHNGKERAFAFLVGQVMKATKGKAPPSLVNELLKKKLQK